MAIEKNAYRHLLDIIDATTAPNKKFVCVERTLAITAVVLLILAACAFAKAGAFAGFEHAHALGFTCIGALGCIALTKSILLSLQCCRTYFMLRSSDWVSVGPVEFTDEQRRNAIPL